MPTSYNALQAQVHKSLSRGLEFQASYTWSKAIDWTSNPYTNVENFYNLKAEWGPASYSFKHMFVINGLYALPIGRGKAILGSANPFVQAVAGGWNLASIISLRSGQPFNVGTGADIANIGSSSQRPNRTGASPYAAVQTPQTWLNKAGFAQPASYTFGNEKRDDLFGPTYRDVDFNASKNFPLVESTTLQFRAEFFNLFNTTNYSNPNATLNSSSFGTITSSVSGREIQFALKIIF